MHRPNAAGTDAGAYAASDAPIGIGNIPIRATRQCFPADGPLRAGFQAHSAIPAGPATDTTVKIPVTTAVLGGEAEVATLTGKVVCRIKPGTQSGSRIRLKGKGIVSMKDASVHGDQYVTVQIDVPKNLSAAAKQKLREFEEACKGGSSRGAA